MSRANLSTKTGVTKRTPQDLHGQIAAAVEPDEAHARVHSFNRRDALGLTALGGALALTSSCKHAGGPGPAGPGALQTPLPLGLPDPLQMRNGARVENAAAWTQARRPEILALFEEHVYGKAPARPGAMNAKIMEEGSAWGGTAIRRQVRLSFGNLDKPPTMDLLIYLPSSARQTSVPLFVILNFNGNHTTTTDPAVLITESWVRNKKSTGSQDHTASEAGRGTDTDDHQVEAILARGYGVATAYYGDLAPDDKDKYRDGVHRLTPDEASPAAWGAIGAWAWGLQRALDHFETDRQIDHKRVAVVGHSRLGKTALWAGAQDERFALVISNDSGCGGAALSRQRNDGKKRETVERINHVFPHWFCGNFKQYSNNEGALPLDQHMLVALMAPRAVYVASALEDEWADPPGEFNSLLYADPVYRLLGTSGLPVKQHPPVDSPVTTGTMGYHIRTGPHALTAYDWQQYLTFADLHLRSRA